MKTRLGFISNSSSASFVVIGKDNYNFPELPNKKLVIPDSFGGEDEFGWGPDRLNDFGSKLNLAYMLAFKYRYNDYGQEWLIDLLKKYLKVDEIEDNITDDVGYIDHQSVDDLWDEIFMGKENLKQFLFCADSEIVVDNDNH